MDNFFGIASIFAILSAIAATILAFIFIVPNKKRDRLNKVGKFLHDTLNFKYLIVEKILQALYIFATAFVILLGFCMLFYVRPGYSYYYYSQPSVWYGGYGLLVMVLGPIALRLVYEFLMMTILLIKNVIQINNKLKGENNEEKADIFAAPAEVFAQPANTNVCPTCGAEVGDATFCTRCGTKAK